MTKEKLIIEQMEIQSKTLKSMLVAIKALDEMASHMMARITKIEEVLNGDRKL